MSWLSICWFGEDEIDCRSDQVYISLCGARGFSPQQQAFLFVPISGSNDESLIQVADVRDQRCWERSKREIYLSACNASNPLQRWWANNGTDFFASDNKFEISQVNFTKQCVSNDHHPKPGEYCRPAVPRQIISLLSH